MQTLTNSAHQRFPGKSDSFLAMCRQRHPCGGLWYSMYIGECIMTAKPVIVLPFFGTPFSGSWRKRPDREQVRADTRRNQWGSLHAHTYSPAVNKNESMANYRASIMQTAREKGRDEVHSLEI